MLADGNKTLSRTISQCLIGARRHSKDGNLVTCQNCCRSCRSNWLSPGKTRRLRLPQAKFDYVGYPTDRGLRLCQSDRCLMKRMDQMPRRLSGFSSGASLGGKVLRYRKEQDIYIQGTPADTPFYIQEGGGAAYHPNETSTISSYR